MTPTVQASGTKRSPVRARALYTRAVARNFFDPQSSCSRVRVPIPLCVDLEPAGAKKNDPPSRAPVSLDINPTELSSLPTALAHRPIALVCDDPGAISSIPTIRPHLRNHMPSSQPRSALLTSQPHRAVSLDLSLDDLPPMPQASSPAIRAPSILASNVSGGPPRPRVKFKSPVKEETPRHIRESVQERWKGKAIDQPRTDVVDLTLPSPTLASSVALPPIPSDIPNVAARPGSFPPPNVPEVAGYPAASSLPPNDPQAAVGPAPMLMRPAPRQDSNTTRSPTPGSSPMPSFASTPHSSQLDELELPTTDFTAIPTNRELAIEFDPNGPPIAAIPMECDIKMEGDGPEEDVVEETNASETSSEGSKRVRRPPSKKRKRLRNEYHDDDSAHFHFTQARRAVQRDSERNQFLLAALLSTQMFISHSIDCLDDCLERCSDHVMDVEY